MQTNTATSRTFKALKNQVFRFGNFELMPIRDEDKHAIMKWRNEQIYHLRQTKPLTKEAQETYFSETVSSLFIQEKPGQLLFSYLENGICIGYGGLVHINWQDKHAEISFLMDTALEKEYFQSHWVIYLSLIEQVAFGELGLHKIFTFGFDLRPQLFRAVEVAGFAKEAVLKEHYFWEGKYVDAIIHSKFRPRLVLRVADERDLERYFDWTNDEVVRRQSFNSKAIDFQGHAVWFKKRLADENSHLYVFENENSAPVGQIRIEYDPETSMAVIGVSIDKNFRGMRLAPIMLKQAVERFSITHKNCLVQAFIKKGNEGSIKSFVNAGFLFDKELHFEGHESFLYTFKTK